jgi:hypothetical protein
MAVCTGHRLGGGMLEMVWAAVDTPLLEETGINMDIGELTRELVIMSGMSVGWCSTCYRTVGRVILTAAISNQLHEGRPRTTSLKAEHSVIHTSKMGMLAGYIPVWKGSTRCPSRARSPRGQTCTRPCNRRYGVEQRTSITSATCRRIHI